MIVPLITTDLYLFPVQSTSKMYSHRPKQLRSGSEGISRMQEPSMGRRSKVLP